MSEDASRIQRFVSALIRRERSLLVVRVAARVALLGLLVLAMSVIAPVLGAARAPAALAVVLAAGIGVWLAVFLPLLGAWRRSSDRLHQARVVERLRPGLRGRLVTAVEQEGAGDRSSPELLGLVVSRAAAGVEDLSPEQVHDGGSARWWALGAGVGWVAGLPALLGLAGGPAAFVDYWAAGSSARAEMSSLQVDDPAEVAHVGDLLLRYTYPDYTGLEPREVPNSTGDAHGPPGTVVEVTARAGYAVSAAGLVAYGEALEARVEEDGRAVTGRFTIRSDEGTYAVLLYRDAEAEPSRDFKISPVDDLPPEIVLDTDSGEIEVAADQAFAIGWHVRDDYGISKVALAIDGQDVTPVLRTPEERVAELHELQEWFTPRELGLREGQRVQLSVVAYDNDTVSGAKRGTSREVALVVLGPNGLTRRASQRREELLSTMVPILARFLTEEWPPGTRGGHVSRWGEEVSGRYEPLVELAAEIWTNQADDPDGVVAKRVLDAGRNLVRYTQVSFLPGSPTKVNDDALAMTDNLRIKAVESLEDGILWFHKMRRNDALRELVQQSGELEQMSEQLQDLLSNPDAEAQELLARLDQLDRMMQRLAAQAEKLDQDGMGLREFLNTRESEAQNLMEEIRKAIAAGNLDEARELMERLSNLVGEMGAGIKQELQRQQSQAGEQQDRGADLQAELEKLEAEQRALQSEVQALREKDSGGSDQAAALWKKLDALSAEHGRSAVQYGEGLVKHERRLFERARAEAAADEAQDLEAAIRARDPNGARRSVEEGARAWDRAAGAMELERSSGRDVRGPGRSEIAQLLRQLQQISRLLDQLEQAQRPASGEQARQARDLQDRQRDLDNRLREAQRDAQDFAQRSPVRPDGLEEALERASERMTEASRDLDHGQLMQAEGSQGAAAQRLREAIESVQQAQEQAQQQAMRLSQPQQRAQQPPQGGQQQRGQDGRDDQTRQMRIPGREEFVAPEEYRRGLIEGQQGEVPDEYRAMKRRYYEELVHQ